MLAKYSTWLLLSLVPWTLVNATETITNYCESLPDEPSHSAAIETQVKHQLDKFEKKNNEDFFTTNGKGYHGFCYVFLREPQRPRQILTAYWLKFDGYWARVKRIRDECMEDNKKSLASARGLCKLAISKMEAASKQHTRDIRYLVDNTVVNRCTDLAPRGDCQHWLTCMKPITSRDQERVNEYAKIWSYRNVLPGCRIAKHTDLVEGLRSRLNTLHEYYKKPLTESKPLSATELEAENRLDDKIQVEGLNKIAMTKLEDIHKHGMKTIQDNQTETILGLCLTTLGDMQTVVEDYFNEIMAIRENAWKCQDIQQKIVTTEEKAKKSDADWASHIDQFKSDLTRKFDQMHTHFKIWFEDRHKIRQKLLTDHSSEKLAEFNKQFDEALGKLDEIRRQAHSQSAHISTQTEFSTEIDFVNLKLLCPKILEEMENKVLHHDRLEVKLIGPKLVPKPLRYIEDADSLAPEFSKAGLDADVKEIAAKVTEVADTYAGINLITEASKSLRDKLYKNYKIWSGHLQKAFNVIANKQKLCRPFQCSSVEYEFLKSTWASTDYNIRKKLEEFIPLFYITLFMTKKTKIEKVTKYITERYVPIYKLIMEKDWHTIVNQLIQFDFKLFRTQNMVALTDSYDVK